jgi:hypothetical protein
MARPVGIAAEASGTTPCSALVNGLTPVVFINLVHFILPVLY